jgi:putative molybdopterin biosynthesis protein
MQEEQYYTLKEVSKMLKVAYLTVYRWVKSEKLTTMKAGKQYRVRKTDLDMFLNRAATINPNTFL